MTGDKQILQRQFELSATNAAQSDDRNGRSEHRMLLDFRKDSNGDYLSACERAAFWAWKTAKHFYDDFAGDTMSVSQEGWSRFGPGGIQVVQDIPLDKNVTRGEEPQYFDRLPNRNGMAYRHPPHIDFASLPEETKDVIRAAAKKAFPRELNEIKNISFTVTTSRDLPPTVETRRAVEFGDSWPILDQMAFIPALQDIPFSEENSKRVDEVFDKLKEKLIESKERLFPNKSVYITTPESSEEPLVFKDKNDLY